MVEITNNCYFNGGLIKKGGYLYKQQNHDNLWAV